MALITALSVLFALTVPMLALLSATAFERLIARNLVDATQALFVAEAGIEWAFNLMASTPDWKVVFIGSDGTTATLAPPADLLPWGTTTVTVRDGNAAEAGNSPVSDGVVVVTSTGRVNRAQRTIEAIVRRGSTGAPGGAGTPPTHSLVNWRER